MPRIRLPVTTTSALELGALAWLAAGAGTGCGPAGGGEDAGCSGWANAGAALAISRADAAAPSRSRERVAETVAAAQVSPVVVIVSSSAMLLGTVAPAAFVCFINNVNHAMFTSLIDRRRARGGGMRRLDADQAPAY
jgi:hypothetical protein